MFAKSKVSQAVIDAVNSVLEIKVEEKNTTQPSDIHRVPMAPADTKTSTLSEASEKVATPTGMKVYGSSYGNSAKARRDQTKSAVDDLKGPKDKEVKEELKGNQEKIDANKNDKIDAQDFEILRKKKVKEDMQFAKKLLETQQPKSPAKNTDVADKSYLKDLGKKPTVKSDLKNLGRFLTGKKETNEELELDQQINEVLSKDATAGDWIHDFVHSDNPKFAGKSKAERKKMALGAYYAKQNEETELAEKLEPEVKSTDTLAGRKAGGKKDDVGPGADGKSTKVKFVPEEKDNDNVPFDKPYTKIKNNIKDKSGAIHTPMSRARDLARTAFAKIKKDHKEK